MATAEAPPPSDGATSAVTVGQSPEPTVRELVNSIRDAFQSACFTEMESILTRREDKMSKEIAALRDRCEAEKLERMIAEEEVKKVKSECEKLKKENCELKCAIENAEAQVGVYKKRLESLEARVLEVEKDLELLSRNSASDRGKGVSGEMGFGRNEMGCEGFGGRGERRELLVSEGNGERENAGVETRTEVVAYKSEKPVKVRVDLIEYGKDSQAGAGGAGDRRSTKEASGSIKPASKDIVEILDSDDEKSTQNSENRVLKRKLFACCEHRNTSKDEDVNCSAATHKTARVAKSMHGSGNSPSTSNCANLGSNNLPCSRSDGVGKHVAAEQKSPSSWPLGRLSSLAADKNSHISKLLETLATSDSSDSEDSSDSL